MARNLSEGIGPVPSCPGLAALGHGRMPGARFPRAAALLDAPVRRPGAFASARPRSLGDCRPRISPAPPCPGTVGTAAPEVVDHTFHRRLPATGRACEPSRFERRKIRAPNAPDRPLRFDQLRAVLATRRCAPSSPAGTSGVSGAQMRRASSMRPTSRDSTVRWAGTDASPAGPHVIPGTGTVVAAVVRA